MRALTVSCIGLLFAALAFGVDGPRHSYKPKEGYVPDAKTATAIAIAIWEPIYGAERIARERPYHARLTNGVWLVEGTLPCGVIGGVAEVEIAKDDARVLRVTHGK